MIEWIGDNAWVAWLGFAAILAAAELVSMDFVLVMLAVGAGGGAIAAALGAPVLICAVVFAAVSCGMLFMVRPSMLEKLHRGPTLTSGTDALVGREAVVLSAVDRHGGTVKLQGETWTARSYDSSLTLEVGSHVQVFEIDGATAVVYPSD